MFLRRADVIDADAVREVFLSATAGKPHLLADEPDAGRPEWIAAFLDCGYMHELWVAEVDGRIVGFATLAIDQLGHLYVAAEFQNRGVGSALLRNAQRVRPEKLTLYTHRHDVDARRFYERHGFTVAEIEDDEVFYTWRHRSPN
ncbi:GNAT family N-acetyltransferase [Herbidospora sp. RD11066]